MCFLRGFHATAMTALPVKAMEQEKDEHEGETRKKGRREDRWERERNGINSGRGKGGGKDSEGHS